MSRRHTPRSRAERFWLGAYAALFLGVLGGLILADWASPAINFEAAWWHRPVGPNLPLWAIGGLLVLAAGGLTADLGWRLPRNTSGAVWWFAFAQAGIVAWWGMVAAFPSIVVPALALAGAIAASFAYDPAGGHADA
jgi:hypothetical protein